MKNKIFLFLLLVSFPCFCLDIAMPDVPWFDHVTQPTAQTPEQLGTLAIKLHQALKQNLPLDQIASLAPKEQTPRVIFITIGGDSWPGRTYFGAGYNFQNAFRVAVDILCANEPIFAKETQKLAQATLQEEAKAGHAPSPEWQERQKNPNAWNWLRLDVVQYAKPSFGFSVEHSRLALTSLVGFTFGPDFGFAFLPEQITGRCLITDNSHISQQQVANLISETYNWNALKAWMKLSAVDAGHRICLYEVDSFYTDGTTAVPLYRGHSLPNALPTAQQCQELARKTADALIALLDPETGKLTKPFPEWFTSDTEELTVLKDALRKKDGKLVRKKKKITETVECEHVAVISEFCYALARLAQTTQDARYAQAAALAMKPVLKNIIKSPLNKQHYIVREKETVDAQSLQIPREISILRTNAITCLAMIELKKCGAPLSIPPEQIALRLAAHIKSQLAPGDEFNNAILCSTGQTFDEETGRFIASLEDNALAIVALSQLHKLIPDTEALSIAQKCAQAIYDNKISHLPLEALNKSPVIPAALACLGNSDKPFVLQMARLGDAVSADMEVSPLYPDTYGSIKQYPCCTLTAERTLALACISRWMRENGKASWAIREMNQSLPMLLFQIQGAIGPAEASSLAYPKKYIGFFRDNLENYGFDLAGQTMQILSLNACAEELANLKLYGQELLWLKVLAARKAVNTHPNPLNVELVLTRPDEKDPGQRDLIGGFSEYKQKTHRVRTKQSQPKPTSSKYKKR